MYSLHCYGCPALTSRVSTRMRVAFRDTPEAARRARAPREQSPSRDRASRDTDRPTGKMATLRNVREAECEYRERNAYLDPYRVPIAPHKILRSQFPPCSVCFPQRLVGARELPAVCQCGAKSRREALQYCTSNSPDPQEILPSDDHIKVSGGDCTADAINCVECISLK